ncbi:MAG: AmmeMemoRadiSam system protein A [Nitrospira sp.]|nr:AmmeMemoRadiSam system protein A [Nitrospira sp.]
MHPIVELAKKSIETYVRESRIIEPPEPLPPEMSERAGVFVCIKKHGQLRGCIGTITPCQANLAMEVIKNAISSAMQDPRFDFVRMDELEELDYSVDVLSHPQKIEDLNELDPKRYGVIVASGGRRGVLLPDLEGVDTVEEQLRITRMKAGILPDEDVEIYRFEVKRYR